MTAIISSINNQRSAISILMRRIKAVAVLALALESPMRVALDARDLVRRFRPCRSVLIEPNQLHLINTGQKDHVFILI